MKSLTSVINCLWDEVVHPVCEMKSLTSLTPWQQRGVRVRPNKTFKKSTPPHNRKLDIVISNSQKEVDDFVGKLTFYDEFAESFCEKKMADECDAPATAWSSSAPQQYI